MHPLVTEKSFLARMAEALMTPICPECGAKCHEQTSEPMILVCSNNEHWKGNPFTANWTHNENESRKFFLKDPWFK